MSVSWAHSPPGLLREHHARDAAALAGDLPGDVSEAGLSVETPFQGGILFTPQEPTGEAIVVYFHGGGFLAGSPVTHRAVTAWLAHATGLRILSARYRLTPEDPYPAQQDDALAAIRHAVGMAGPAGVILAGDSAGACVALWGYHGLPAAERSAVRGLVLFYGGFGLVESDSITRYGSVENGLNREALANMYAQLAPPPAPAPPWPHEFASTVTAPVLIVAAGLDAVLDDSLRLARTLAPHPRHRLDVAQQQDHGFLKRAGTGEAVAKLIDGAANWMRECVGQEFTPGA